MAQLANFSLEALMDLEVTSVSKKVESLVDAPAAIFVITQEDIRRSGATSLAEALRMVPGLYVAKVDASKWVLTARGFSDRFANKLLVLLDGRSVYSTLFSGVFWEQQDTLLEDLDRIEVIRGPGATLWGANAVNGVINIITKDAAETQGTLLAGGVGTEARALGAFRYGGALGERGHFRVYAKGFESDAGATAAHQPAGDDWDSFQAGFRYDGSVRDGGSLTIQGDATRVRAQQLSARAGMVLPSQYHPQGWNLLARWEPNDGRGTSVQLYYDRLKRGDDVVAGILEHTLDLDFQQRFQPRERHEVVWGLGYRYYHSTEPFSDGAFVSGLIPARRTARLVSGFIQDDILQEDRNLRWTVGSKFEHNEFTGFEVQPTARVLYAPDDRRAVWASVSRAVRTAAVVEDDFLAASALYDPADPATVAAAAADPLAALAVAQGLPVVAALIGDRTFDSEELTAYEIGYRVRPASGLYLDLTGFYHDYDNLRSLALRPNEIGDPRWAALFTGLPVAPPHIVAPFRPGNNGSGETYGLELAADWHVSSACRVRAAYSHLQTDLRLNLPPGAVDPFSMVTQGSSPRNQFSLRAAVDVRDDFDLDLWLRYADALPSMGVDSYLTLDARLAWRPSEDLEVALVGQNLFQRDHFEYGADILGTQPTQIQRGVYGKVTRVF